MAASNVRVTAAHTGEMMGIPGTGRSFEYVTPNIGRFADGRASLRLRTIRGLSVGFATCPQSQP